MQKNKKLIEGILIGLIVLIAGFMVFQNLGKDNMRIWDEARGAVNAIEMMQNGNYLVVKYEGQPDRWNTKSPFFIWLKVISYKTMGISEFSARFPSALASFLTALLMLFFSRKFLDDIYSGLLSVLTLVSTFGYMTFHVARSGEPDSILTFFVFAYSIAWFILLEKYPKKRSILFAAFGTGMFLAIFTKNIAGLAPFAGSFIYTLIRYKVLLKLLKDFRTYITAIGVILLIVGYFAIRDIYDPGYSQIVIKQEITGMFFDYFVGEPKHPESTFYWNYLWKIGLQEYLIAFILGIPAIFLIKKPIKKRFVLFNYLVSGIFVFGYSLSISKNEWYIAPVYPFIAMNIGIFLHQIILFISQKLKNKLVLKNITLSLLILFVLTTFVVKSSEIIKKTTVSKPYHMVFPGNAIKYYHNKYPQYNEITMLTSFNQDIKSPNLDQLRFYTKKYEFEGSLKTEITKIIDENLIGKYVITCEDKLSNSYLDFEIIDFNDYSVFVKINGIKEPLIDSIVNVYAVGGEINTIMSGDLVRLDLGKINLINLVALKHNSTKNEWYLWEKDSLLTIFTEKNGKYEKTQHKYLPAQNFSTKDIIDIALDEDKETAYVFYKGDKVSSGTIFRLDSKRKIYKTSHYTKYSYRNVIGIALDAKKDIFITWYKDGKVSMGSSYNLSEKKAPSKYMFPLAFSNEQILNFNIDTNSSVETVIIKN